MQTLDHFEWLGDDALLHVVDLIYLDDNAEVWNARRVCLRFKNIIGDRIYALQAFMAHPHLLDAMTPHKGMWRAARDEILQEALLGKLNSPIAILNHATQDVQDVLNDPDKLGRLTLYDLCVITNNNVLVQMVNINIPIVRFIIKWVKIPRRQLVALPPASQHLKKKALLASGGVNDLYESMIDMCNKLKNHAPFVQFLDLHRQYFTIR